VASGAPSLNPTRVLLIADANTGSVLSERLTSTGNDVYWARDTMEAKWLWLANFYASVVIAVAKDPAGASGLVERMKRDAPRQEIVLLDDEEIFGGMNKPVPPVPRIANATARGKTLVGTRKQILKMPKRSRRPKL
jgi:hypothetical protein